MGSTRSLWHGKRDWFAQPPVRASATIPFLIAQNSFCPCAGVAAAAMGIRLHGFTSPPSMESSLTAIDLLEYKTLPAGFVAVTQSDLSSALVSEQLR